MKDCFHILPFSVFKSTINAAVGSCSKDRIGEIISSTNEPLAWKGGFAQNLLKGVVIIFLPIFTMQLSGCSLFDDKGDDNPCLDPASIEWGAAYSEYSDVDPTLGYGQYPEGRTASSGSACIRESVN